MTYLSAFYYCLSASRVGLYTNINLIHGRAFYQIEWLSDFNMTNKLVDEVYCKMEHKQGVVRAVTFNGNNE